MVEVHPDPEAALSDAEQQITPEQFGDLMTALRPIHEQVRGLHGDPVMAEGVAGPAGGRH
jgi:3-deoxy-D-manno-octulosonic acid (KDO) 8-phosphate synthase